MITITPIKYVIDDNKGNEIIADVEGNKISIYFDQGSIFELNKSDIIQLVNILEELKK